MDESMEQGEQGDCLEVIGWYGEFEISGFVPLGEWHVLKWFWK